MPARKPKPRARRSAPVAWPRLPKLEQRQLDLIGLGLVAAAHLLRVPDLSRVGRRRGRRVGRRRPALARRRRATTSCRWRCWPRARSSCCGTTLPAVRPFRSGGLCLFAAAALGLAAGTLGLGPGGSEVRWDPEWVAPARRAWWGRPCTGAPRRRSAWSAPTSSPSSCSWPRVLLLTGASIAGVVKATTDSVSTTTRDMRAAVQRRRATEELEALEVERAAGRRARRRPRRSGKSRSRSGPARIASPTSTTSRPRSSPNLNPRSRCRPSRGWPRIPRPTSPASRAAAGDPEQLTPQGRYRPHVTESPDFVWKVPDPAASEALVRGGGAARHRRAGEGRRPAARGARALRRRGARDRHGRRPAHHPLRAAAGAGHQGRQGRPAQGRPRVRAGGVRHPHPGADPRQAGGRRRGPERAPADRAPRRRLPGAAAGLVAADRLARQGRRRPRDRRRPGQDAAPAGGRHDRRGQVRRASTRCCPRSCCARRRTRCAWCSSTPSRSSSRTTTRSRTC